MRTNFQLDQTIALVVGNLFFDLHNCFDFVGYEYHPSEKKAKLEWLRDSSDWVPSVLPHRLILFFDGVTNFAVQRRNDDTPFTEDDCLASISFLPAELRDFFDAVCPDHRSDDEHMSICFQSGASIKIWAESVTLETKDN